MCLYTWLPEGLSEAPSIKAESYDPSLSETPYLRLTTEAPVEEGLQNPPVEAAWVVMEENMWQRCQQTVAGESHPPRTFSPRSNQPGMSCGR